MGETFRSRSDEKRIRTLRGEDIRVTMGESYDPTWVDRLRDLPAMNVSITGEFKGKTILDTPDGWTPLTEAKPPEDGLYLVFCPSSGPEKPRVAVVWCHANEGWGWSLNRTWLTDTITHWMPLPEPPKGGDR